MENPQAFPVWVKDGDYANGGYIEGGMSLRDHFAAKALQGLIASFAHPNGSLPRPSDNAELAEYAYQYADLMLAARTKP